MRHTAKNSSRPTGGCMTELHKLPGETEEKFIWRLGMAKEAGDIQMNWEEIAKIINKEFREDESEYYNESAYRKPYQQAKRFYEAGVFKDLTDEKYVELIRTEQRELKKERQKFSDEKLEYNRWLREEARDELICEKICDAIQELGSLPLPSPIVYNHRVDKEGILCFADTHYGTEFEIKGLRGEVINHYSPEIFEARMAELLTLTIDKARKEGLSKIKVYSLGDELDGILRCSQLRKLRYGVVESAIKYADYICRWLSVLTMYVDVEYHMVQGNHTELRMLGQPKGTFKEDNMSEIIKVFIDTRMKDNPNFTLKTNASGLIFDEVAGYNILGIHGEVKNMERAIKDFSTIYNTQIDILIGGHLHHYQGKNIGVNKDVIGVASVVGSDDFSISLGKTANAGATFLIVEEDKGVIELSMFKFVN